jgi:hypothetical protein
MRETEKKGAGFSGSDRDPHCSLCTEKQFHAMLHLEAGRSARSGKPCLLMLLGVAGLGQSEKNGVVGEVARALLSLTRETDPKGWWCTGSQIGILFTEVDAPSPAALIEAQRTIKRKIIAALCSRVGDAAAERITISWTVFPNSFLESQEA